jgi:hypothetical protein
MTLAPTNEAIGREIMQKKNQMTKEIVTMIWECHG